MTVFRLLEGVLPLSAGPFSEEGQQRVMHTEDISEFDSLVLDHEYADFGMQNDQVGPGDAPAWRLSLNIECGSWIIPEGFNGDLYQCGVVEMIDPTDAHDLGLGPEWRFVGDIASSCS